MQIEDYFDFVSPNEIQLKGHRIWIENVLYEYIHNALSADELVQRFPTLSLEQIYATLLYYVRNKAAMDEYLANWLEHGRRMRQVQAEHPTPAMLRLRQLRAERESQRHQRREPTLA